MDSNVSNARDLIALRSTLSAALTIAEVRSVNWAVVAKAAGPAIARGWTGDELALWAIGDLGESTENAGGAIVAVLRDLGTVDPPRPPATPQPPPVQDVLAEIHGRHQPARTPEQWTARIRAQLAAGRRS